MIPAHTIQHIRETSKEHIVDLIGEHVALKKSGKDFKGKCPFHGDTSPSMSVSEQRGMFKCFVCDEGGDPVHFLIEHTGKSYIEVIKELASRFHIPIETEQRKPGSVPFVPKEELIPGLKAMKPRIRKEGYVILFFSDQERDAFVDLDVVPWLQLQHPVNREQARIIGKLTEFILFRTDSKTMLNPVCLQSVAAFLTKGTTGIWFLKDDCKPEMIRDAYTKSIQSFPDLKDWLTGFVHAFPSTETARLSISRLIALIDHKITRSTYKSSFFERWEEKNTLTFD